MRYLFFIALMALIPPVARGDGLFYQLPKDGEWVRFDLDLTQDRQGMHQMSRGTLSMSSVGRSVEGAEPCRWIEVKLQLSDQGMEHTIVAKVLVPEKYLKKGEDSLNQMVRGWMSDKGSQDVVRLEASNFGPLRAFLAGPLEDEKKLDKEVVESKLGKLECEGVVGTTPVTEGNRQGKFTFHNRLHTKAPFGLVSSRIEFEFKSDGQVVEKGTAILKVADFGTDAKSELPSNQ